MPVAAPGKCEVHRYENSFHGFVGSLGDVSEGYIAPACAAGRGSRHAA